MINLEELDLHFVICGENRFIDGYNLKYNIIDHLVRLNKFLFNIRSCLLFNDQVDFISNEDCQHSFNTFKNKKIISCINYFPDRKYGECHVYSYPYRAKSYELVTNNLPNEFFPSVREVSLYDERPFEHEFLMKIAKSFPFMEELSIYNDEPQKKKSYEELSIIQYPYLNTIDLLQANDDYVEQFLLDTRTCLLRPLKFMVSFSTLKRITHNFTRNATRTNCEKILSIYIPRNISISKELKDYFPYTEINFELMEIN